MLPVLDHTGWVHSKFIATISPTLHQCFANWNSIEGGTKIHQFDPINAPLETNKISTYSGLF